MILELKPEIENKVKAKGLDALLFEFEAPIIIAPSNGKELIPDRARVPDWLLARIRYERLERQGKEELATPSELVAYLMTAYDFIRLDKDLLNVYEKYFSDIIRRLNNPDAGMFGFALNSHEQCLAYDLRKWIYRQQGKYLLENRSNPQYTD
jgi:hypothetical protein